jgi:hypothetical protein
MDCSGFAGESRTSLSTFHRHPANEHGLSESTFGWISQTAWVCDRVAAGLRELGASVIDGLSVKTGVNTHIHVMDVVLKLNPSESGKIVRMTGSD